MGFSGTSFNGTRDAQRQHVYEWEHCPSWNKGVYEWKNVVALVEDACAAYGLTPPDEIKDGRRARKGGATSDMVRLPLNGFAVSEPGSKKVGRAMGMILHECAHNITLRFNSRCEPHGPEFVRVLIDLLERFAGADGVERRRAARAAKVRVAQAADAPAILPKRDVKRLSAIRERRRAIRLELEALDREWSQLRTRARNRPTPGQSRRAALGTEIKAARTAGA